jgi:glycosyltransferase EpsD
VYVADFSKRKNQSALIKAFASTADKIGAGTSGQDVRLVFAGDGATLEECKRLADGTPSAADLNVSDKIDFLGFVNDVPELLRSCDCAVSTSRYEGLPFNIMEAMAAGLPVVASNIAGHTDLLGDCGGDIGERMVKMCGQARVEYDLTPYTLESVMPEWRKIFERLLG